MPNWDHVLKEIQKEKNDASGSASDKVRTKYLMQLQAHVDRNIICYYSGFLAKPKVEGVEINDEDKNGFMLCVHKLDKSKGLDLFIHTPGGDGAATASIVHYLKEIFGNNIRLFRRSQCRLELSSPALAKKFSWASIQISVLSTLR